MVYFVSIIRLQWEGLFDKRCNTPWNYIHANSLTNLHGACNHFKLQTLTSQVGDGTKELGIQLICGHGPTTSQETVNPLQDKLTVMEFRKLSGHFGL